MTQTAPATSPGPFSAWVIPQDNAVIIDASTDARYAGNKNQHHRGIE